MASDVKKKKIESLSQSIQRLNDSLILAKKEGDNKRLVECLQKIISRFEADLKAIRSGSIKIQ